LKYYFSYGQNINTLVGKRQQESQDHQFWKTQPVPQGGDSGVINLILSMLMLAGRRRNRKG